MVGVAALLHVVVGADPDEAFGAPELFGHHANWATRCYADAVYQVRIGQSAAESIVEAETCLLHTPFVRRLLRTIVAPTVCEIDRPLAIEWLREADAFCAAAGERGCNDEYTMCLDPSEQPFLAARRYGRLVKGPARDIGSAIELPTSVWPLPVRDGIDRVPCARMVPYPRRENECTALPSIDPRCRAGPSMREFAARSDRVRSLSGPLRRPSGTTEGIGGYGRTP